MEWIVSYPGRLDAFLAAQGHFESRAKAQEAIEQGLVEVNEEVVRKAAHRLQEGEVVKVSDAPFDKAQGRLLEPMDLRLPILYEDQRCLVINKPAGIAVQPGAGTSATEATILHGIAHLFKRRRIPFADDATLVHRIDKGTTGCLLIAKDKEAHALLQREFQERRIEKQYLAVIAGVPSPTSAVIDAPVGRSTRDPTTMGIVGTTAPREAQTTYRTLAVSVRKDAALLLCTLHTGRTHQIRVHLHAIGHPILGDDTYTSPQSEMVTQDYEVTTICLHAWKLTFISPHDGMKRTTAAPLPFTLTDVLKRAGIPHP